MVTEDTPHLDPQDFSSSDSMTYIQVFFFLFFFLGPFLNFNRRLHGQYDYAEEGNEDGYGVYKKIKTAGLVTSLHCTRTLWKAMFFIFTAWACF